MEKRCVADGSDNAVDDSVAAPASNVGQTCGQCQAANKAVRDGSEPSLGSDIHERQGEYPRPLSQVII